MLLAENISYKAGNKKILNNVSVQAIPGEVLAIIGPNGAGKTSLLKILTGLIPSGKGVVKLDNKSLKSYSKKQLAQKRAVLSQSVSLSLPYSVEEVVMMGRYAHFNDVPSAKDHEVLEEVMFETGVHHLKTRSYITLSGGEKQRVQLARVLAQVWNLSPENNEVRYLFMDEPVSALDLLHQHKTLEITAKLKQRGFVVIAVLHDLNLAAQYADKILVLNSGEVAAYDIPESILTEKIIEEVYQMKVSVFRHPNHQFPIIVPERRHDAIEKKVITETFTY